MNQKTSIYLIISLSLLAIWFFVLYLPYQNEKAATEIKISECYQQLDDFSKTMTMFPLILNQKKDLEQRKDFVNSKLYSKKQVLNLFNRLKLKASGENLIVNEITPPVDELLKLNAVLPDSLSPQFLNIGMSIDGDYLDFGEFVNKLEQEDYFRGINRCIISRVDENRNVTNYFIGFKALLGNLKSES